MMLTAILIVGLALFLGLIASAGLNAVFQTTFNHGQDVINATVTITGDEKVYAELTIPASDNDDFVIGGDPDNVKGYVILPTFDGTLTTTNTSGAADVITLTANQPLAWNNASGIANGHFANRNVWTNWNFANSDDEEGTVTILIIRDGTP